MSEFRLQRPSMEQTSVILTVQSSLSIDTLMKLVSVCCPASELFTYMPYCFPLSHLLSICPIWLISLFNHSSISISHKFHLYFLYEMSYLVTSADPNGNKMKI